MTPDSEVRATPDGRVASPSSSARSTPPPGRATGRPQGLPLPASPPPVFYEVADVDLPGRPGTLIDALELEAPAGVRGWAVLYRSKGRDGSIVPVSGLVVAPAEGDGPRPVLAWAHGTTGLADACAPSLAGLAGGDIAALIGLVHGGMILASTDYEGLGTAGIHPYLVGVSEGRSILDSIRAAGELPEIEAGERSVVVGISQGGHAALWAGELVDAYAPELDVAGVVAASPPIDLRAIQRVVVGDGGRDVAWLESLMVAASWSQAYGLPLDGFLTREGSEIATALTERCPWDIEPPARNPFRVEPAEVPEWQALLEANSPGHGPARPPILVLAARDDELVPPVTIPVGVERLCATGSRVELRWVDGPHTSTVTEPEATGWILEWIGARLARLPLTHGCD